MFIFLGLNSCCFWRNPQVPNLSARCLGNQSDPVLALKHWLIVWSHMIFPCCSQNQQHNSRWMLYNMLCDAMQHLWQKHGVFIQTTVFHLILHSGWNRFQSEHPTSSNHCESRADLSLEVYQGSWQNNCAHGLGTFVHTDGDTYRCEICETIRFHWSKKKGTSMTTKSHWLECWRCEATVIWFKTLIYFHVVCV